MLRLVYRLLRPSWPVGYYIIDDITLSVLCSRKALGGWNLVPVLGGYDIGNSSRRDRRSMKEKQKEVHVILMNVYFLFQISNVRNSVILCFCFCIF